MSIVAGQIKAVITIDDRQFNTAMKRTNKSLQGLGKRAGKTSSTVSTMFKGFAVAGIVAGLAKISISAVKLAANLEQTKISLQTLTGSKAVGNELIKSIKELANVTPFTSQALLKASKSLLAFDFSAEQIVPTLKKLGDISAGTGKNISELAIIFGKIKSAGRLQGQELNQLIDAGFNPLNDIAKKTGKTMSELKDEMRRGNITFKQVDEAFITATSSGGKFFNLMNAQSNSFSGRLSTLKDSLEQIGETLGGIAIDVLQPVVNELIRAADILKRVLEGKGGKFEIAIVGTTAVTAMIVAMGVLTASVLFLAAKMRAGIARLPMDMRVDAITTGGTRKGTKMSIDKALDALKNDKTLTIHATKLGRLQTIISRTTKFLARIINVFKTFILSITAVAAATTVAIVSLGLLVNAFSDTSEDTKELGLEINGFSMFLQSAIELIKTIGEGIMIMVGGLGKWAMSFETINNLVTDVVAGFDLLGETLGGFAATLGFIGTEITRVVKDMALAGGAGIFDFFTNGAFSEFVNGDIEIAADPNAKRRARQLRGNKDAKAQGILDEEIFSSQIALDIARIGVEFEDMLNEISFDGNIGFDSLNNIADDISDIGLEFNEILKDVAKPTKKEIKRLQAVKNVDTAKNFLGGASGFFGGLLKNAGGLAKQFGFDIPKKEKDFRLSGAFSKGSVEANRILTQRDEQDLPEKATAENTKLTAELLEKILTGGLQLNNVAVAN